MNKTYIPGKLKCSHSKNFNAVFSERCWWRKWNFIISKDVSRGTNKDRMKYTQYCLCYQGTAYSARRPVLTGKSCWLGPSSHARPGLTGLGPFFTLKATQQQQLSRASTTFHAGGLSYPETHPVYHVITSHAISVGTAESPRLQETVPEDWH